MNKQDLIDCFNDNLRKFVSELSVLYEGDSDLDAFKKALSLAIVVDDRKPYRMYNKLANIPYGEYLLNRNDTFFSSPDFEKHVLNSDPQDTLQDGSSPSVLIDKVRTLWGKMDAENKEIVWKYFKVLTLLCRKLV